MTLGRRVLKASANHVLPGGGQAQPRLPPTGLPGLESGSGRGRGGGAGAGRGTLVPKGQY
jgi:hypothetical protein